MGSAGTALADQAARHAIRTDLDINLLVEAGAGSGKTESLAGRMVSLVASGKAQVDQIAAVTFTRKAAAELRGRFRMELERQLASEQDRDRLVRLQAAVSGMEGMFAGTIHSFCARLLRERPVEAGLAPGFREIEEAEDNLLRRSAWRDFIEEARKDDSPDLAALRNAGVNIADLQEAFSTVCRYPDVVFPAGEAACPEASGYWAALDRFWGKLQSLRPRDGAPHTCKVLAKMREFAPMYRRAPRQIAALAKLLKMWEAKTGIVLKWWEGRGPEARELVDEFQANYAEPFLLAWREYLYGPTLRLLLEARDSAATERRKKALINFTDLLLFASRMVREDLTVRAALQKKYRFLFVDEFQDTDPLQLELFFLLAAEHGAGTDWRTSALRPGSLFLVGDPKQSIYRFRRADIEMYQQAKVKIEGTGGRIVSLTTCYRSGPNLCEWVNGIFTTHPPTPATLYQPEFARLDAKDPNAANSLGPIPLSLPVTGKQAEVPKQDALAIAAYIQTEVNAGRRGYGDFLILTRRMKNLGHYADALERVRIPYEVGGRGGLLESEYVQGLITLLSSLANPDDGVALVGVLRGPCFGLSDPELYRFRKNGGAFRLSVPVNDEADRAGSAIRELQEWRNLVRKLPVGAAIEIVLEKSGLLARAAAASSGGGEAGKLLFALDSIRMSCEAGSTLADAIAELEESLELDESDAPVLEPGRRQAVRVMNIHKAKGLESPVVFLADPVTGPVIRADVRIVRSEDQTQGYLKITKSVGWDDEVIAQPRGWRSHEETELEFVKAEELRLLYVAATRARETMIVSEWQKPRQGSQPWQKLSESLTGKESIQILQTSPPAVPDLPDLSKAARDAAAASRNARRHQMEMPGFEPFAVSSLAAHGDWGHITEEESQSGRNWGTLIHGLLEYAAVNLDSTAHDLEAYARWMISEQGFDPHDLGPAVEAISQVRRSRFWETVRSASARLVEVPVSSIVPGETRRLARGIIDIALQCEDGWHIVDYKTDLAKSEQLVEIYADQVKLYAGIWERVTGSRVAFAGLYCVREQALTMDVRGEVRRA